VSMAEKLLTLVKVQKKPGGGFQITIPKGRLAEKLGLRGGEYVRVFFDEPKKSWRYQLNE
jgi:hypothetical protein